MTISETLRANKEKIINDYNNGKSTAKLGEEYNCNCGLIYYILKEFGVEIRKCKKYSKAAKERYFNLIEYMANVQNKGVHLISEALFISTDYVKRAFKKLNIDSSQRIKAIDKSILPEVIKLYEQGYGCSLIAEKFNCSPASIFVMLEKANVDIRKTKKYSYKENIVDNGINTSELSYLWGLFLTDGNVTKDKVRLSICDKDTVEKIKLIFEYNGPIYIKNRGKGRQDMHELCINSVTLANKFKNLGCIPNKTHLITFPNHVPKNLLLHLIRGAAEGDGSIGKTNISITGNLPFLEGIMNTIIEQIGLKKEDFHFYTRHPERKNNIRTMMITRAINCKKIMDWLYMNGNVPENIRMNRKYEAYLKFWKDRVIPERFQ